MSSTPEIKSSPSQKFSPFGIRINKTLLTPCRRVGLSRKRGNQSTPISIMKTPTESSNGNSLKDELPKTPVGYEGSILNRKNTDSLSKAIIQSDKIHKNESVIKNSSCKKVLAQNFALEKCDESFNGELKDLQVLNTTEAITELEIDKETEQENLTVEKYKKKIGNSKKIAHKESSPSLKHVDKIHPEKSQCDEIGAKGDTNSIIKLNPDIDEKKQYKHDTKSKRTTKSKEKISAKKQISNAIVYDSDDDFLPLDTKALKKRKSSISDSRLNKAKSFSLKCNVSLERLDSEKVRSNSFITSDNDNSCDNDLIVRKKKKCVIEDDDVSIHNSPNSVAFNPLFGEISNLHEDDEDMAFTSTPEQDKNDKKRLINMITDLEKCIKEKKKNLEDLKQASIYKSKHNVEELETLTKRWKTGCESGLKILLKHLQAHGTMEMATLLEKLHIPENVIAQLSLSDTYT